MMERSVKAIDATLSDAQVDAPSHAGIVRDRSKTYRSLSIVIPCFNERRWLPQILERVVASPVDLDRQVVVVDDGSNDGSQALLKELVETHRGRPRLEFEVIFHEHNRGKGAALRTGFAAASGDIILVQDADLEYDPEDYPGLTKPIVDGVAKVVYGSRWFNRHFHVAHQERFWFMIGNFVVTHMANLLYRAHITDNATGYKVFDAEVLKSLPLRCERFEFCSEVTAKLRKRGHKIWEVPIYYYPRSIAEGKKIGFGDAVEAVWTLIKYRFVD